MNDTEKFVRDLLNNIRSNASLAKSRGLKTNNDIALYNCLNYAGVYISNFAKENNINIDYKII